MAERYAIYDFETLLNCFTAVFRDYKTGTEREFVIHESRNDFRDFIKFLKNLKKHEYYMIGYNNLGFDGQIVEYLINNRQQFKRLGGEILSDKIHDFAQKIINLPDDERFKQLIPEWNMTIPQLDIYKQRHYDSKNKRTSLKWLQFTMRFENIQSMPVKHDDFITADMIEDVLKYNRNDVRATAEFFKRVKFETDLRLKLSKEYDLNLLNASEPRLAREIFGKFMSDAMGVPYHDLKERRTYRSNISVNNLIFKYVNFKDPILKDAKDFYKNLSFNPYNFEENSLGQKNVQKVFRYDNIPEVVIGLGGIHGCVNPGIYTSRPDWLLHDLDVTSYYPNLGIKNSLYPEHLSLTFCTTYENLFIMRQKIPKDSPVNYIYKIILNSTYGLSKEPNNYMHDPKYTFAITINGQLLILMLAEFVKARVPGLMFYQLNTDGITVGYHPKYKDAVKAAMDEWQKLTQLGLEDKMYSKMIIKDVNNYIAVDDKGKVVKRKGAAFAYSMNPEDRELDYHKNPSALIVPKALEQYFVNGIPIEKTIMESEDIFDFCYGVKIKRDFDLIQHKLDTRTRKVRSRVLHEQVVRYFISTEQCSLQKKYKPGSKKAGKTVNLQKGWNITLFNQYKEKEMPKYNIDYRHYLKRTREVIREIEHNSLNQLQLFE